MWTSALKAHQNQGKAVNSSSTSRGINNTYPFLKKLGCCLIYFPGHFFNYWGWFDTDSTCNVSEYFFVVVSNSWGQITQRSCLQGWRPPQSTLQVAVSAAVTGLRATRAPWNQRQVSYGEMGWQTGLEALQHLLDNMRWRCLAGSFSRQVCVSGSLCLYSSSVCLSTGVSVSLLPLPSWVKRCPIARTNKQTKIPHWCASTFIPTAPSSDSSLNLCLQWRPQPNKITASHDESRSPSKCDPLPALSPPHI